MKRRLSLTIRLTLLFACTSVAVLLGLGLLIGSLVEAHFEALDLDALSGKLQLVEHALHKAQSRADLDALPKQLETSLLGHSGMAFLIRGPDGTTLMSTGAVAFPEALLAPVANVRAKRPLSWTNSDGKQFHGISAWMPTGVSSWTPALVAVGMDMAPHEEFMISFQRTLWSAVVLAAMLSGLLGWIAVRRELAPVRTIRQRAAAITASQLDQRLDVKSVPVELEELVQTLNAMLARLEESFQRLSDFSADLAHELRTPVTNMRTQTQVVLSRPRTAEAYRDVLYSNAEEFERLSRMIADMLFLAKSDHGLIAPVKESIDLAAEVHDLYTFFEAMTDRKKLSVSIEGEGHVLGDRMLIRRAISNVLSNAIRHTPQGGKVGVVIDSAGVGGDLLFRIENTGEPIANAHLPRLFDRFYRAEPSRDESSEGTGLGLAITKSIIDLHGGTISVRSNHGTTCFELRFPRERTIP